MRAILPIILLAVIVAAPDLEVVHVPADAVFHMARDLETLPPDSRIYTRYLTFYNIPESRLLKEIKVMNGHLQHLSREADLQKGYIVPDSDNRLMRINIQDYGWSIKLWEALASEDPYFHINLVSEDKTIATWPGGVWPGDGKHYDPGTFTYYKVAPIRAIAPIIATSPIKKVIELTQSQVPLLRADWFFNQTAAVVNRKTNYYTFLGIKTQKDFEDLIGFDRRIAKRFIILRDAIAESEVTLEPRAICREDKGYWRTLDFIKARDKTDPLEINNEDIENDADVSEVYGFLPNDFWATAAVNLKKTKELEAGQLAAIVPQTIASDKMSKSNDPSIHPNASCMRCHWNGGLKDLDGAWYRSLIANKIPFNFPVYEDARKYRQQYVARRLEPWITKDRTTFSAAVFEATGFGKVADYTAAYAATWEWYEDAKVDIVWAARDLGVTPERLRTALAAKVELKKSRPVLAGLAIGKRIQIRQWEQYNQLFYLELRGHQP